MLFVYFLIMSFMFFYFSLYMIYYNLVMLLEYELISLNSSSIVFLLIFDMKSLLFLSLVFVISCMIILYSNEYMSNEIFKNRFLFLIVLFIVSMMFMILSPNMISILLGWDGLGLISFCLVIYYQNMKSLNSGFLTAFMNRIGDVFILMSIVWILNYGNWNFYFFLYLMSLDEEMYWLFMLVICASITKSAQIPFSSWLPAAMAAPTPISALVHSSTLVTAGVYLMIRFSFFFQKSFFLKGLFYISCFTMFMAGICASFDYNLKKIIAYSTLSQLGLMLSILSLGSELMAYFHMLTHAMFKSMLFMCAGMFIHMMGGLQDIRYMGNLVKVMPVVSLFFLIGNLSISGIPFLAGFYSKDLIMEKMMYMGFGWLNFILYFISLGLTVSYSFRLIYFMLFNKFNYKSLFMIVDLDIVIFSMLILIFFSIVGGSFLSWLLMLNFDFIYLSFFMKLMIMIFMMMGMFMGFFLFKLNYVNNLIYFFSFMFFMPNLSTYGFNYYYFMLNKNLFNVMELGWFEEIGPQNIFNLMIKIMNKNTLLSYMSMKMFFVFMIMMLIMLLMI
uniref:NADH dehydrogenase subunit 5 n=1 Tax=Neucentropus mandjuricus TaxID=1223783 RepID=UPI002114EF12|nr:NADH dehydrogenase subunit 5 [Neucentropus mandjuricus]USL48466.1 NADH dehydrogenase subunit 5 [Neucentropus mandjuricus]